MNYSTKRKEGNNQWVLDEKRDSQMTDLTANFPIEIRKPTSCKFEVSNMFSDGVNFKDATYRVSHIETCFLNSFWEVKGSIILLIYGA